MSGFIKHRESEVSSQSFSCGIPSLDKIIRMTDGSISGIYEDPNVSIHNAILQTFVSSCEHQNQQYFVVSSEEKVLIRFGELEKNTASEQEHLTIAWRYKNLSQGSSRFKWDMLSKISLTSDRIINSIDQLLETLRSQRGLKVCVFSLFGPLFGVFSNESVFKTFFEIKKLTRINRHTVLVSIPQFLIQTNIDVFFDNIIAIRSNLIHSHESSLYHSFIELIKITAVGSLRINELESGRYGIVLKSKRLDVESIDIPPEVPTSSGGCTPSF